MTTQAQKTSNRRGSRTQANKDTTSKSEIEEKSITPFISDEQSQVDGELGGSSIDKGDGPVGGDEGGVGDIDETEGLKVVLTNNSVAGHEILRANGCILAIDGHSNTEFTTTKKELVAIQSALAAKPWIVIKMKAE